MLLSALFSMKPEKTIGNRRLRSNYHRFLKFRKNPGKICPQKLIFSAFPFLAVLPGYRRRNYQKNQQKINSNFPKKSISDIIVAFGCLYKRGKDG